MLINMRELQFYTYTQIKVKQHFFYCCSTFNSHSIGSLAMNINHKMKVKQPLDFSCFYGNDKEPD